MDFSTIQSRLGQLPSTFLRSGNVFGAWQAAQAFQLSEYCSTADSLSNQMNFSTAWFNFLDIWGELFGIPRQPSEANLAYQNRITYILQSPVGTLYSVKAFSQFYFSTPITVTENANGLGYNIYLPSSLTSSVINQYLIALEKIRPAGVPFSLYTVLEVLYLNTYLYVGAAYVNGPYLGGGNQQISNAIPEPINSSQPILPFLLLTDPLLNGQVTL